MFIKNRRFCRIAKRQVPLTCKKKKIKNKFMIISKILTENFKMTHFYPKLLDESKTFAAEQR